MIYINYIQYTVYVKSMQSSAGQKPSGRAELLSVQLLLADLGVRDAGVHETNGPDVLQCNGMGWSPSNNSDLSNTWDDGI